MSTRVGVKCPTCTGASTQRGHQGRGSTRKWLAVAAALALLAAGGVLAGLGVAGLGGGEGQPQAASQAGDEAGADDADTVTEDVAFTGAGGLTLRGSLDLPEGRGEGQPGVVIVPGFGPTTREGVTISGGRVDALYADLGQALADRGVVVLRYDKRGTGASDDLPADSPLTFDQHVEDAAAAVEALAQRPEVDPSRVAVVGHDQGGLVGMRLAGDAEAPVAALGLIATPGRPLAEAVADEIRGGDFVEDDEEAEELAAEFEAAVDELLASGEIPEVSSELEPVLPARSAAFLASVFSLDPAELAADVDVPVLIARGEHDPGIRREDVEALQDAFVAAPAVEILRVPGAGSTLAQVPEDSPGGTEDEHQAGSSSDDMHEHPAGAGSAPLQPRDQDALRRFTEWVRRALHG